MTRALRDQSDNPASVLLATMRRTQTSSTSPSAATTTPLPLSQPTATGKKDERANPAVADTTTTKVIGNGESAHQNDGKVNSVDQNVPTQTLCPDARLRIHIDDLSHPAVSKFTQTIDLSKLLQDAILNVQKFLFSPQDDIEEETSRRPPHQRPVKPNPDWKPQEVRSVTLILRPMEGVAYTTGTTLDEAHKEIHLSLDYLQAKINDFSSKASSRTSTSAAAPTASRLPDSADLDCRPSSSISPDDAFRHEVRGVVIHEMVHVFQHNGKGSCPGGLIEGIADYVRLKSSLDPPHWNPWPANHKTRGKKFDEGYQKSAWFLEWVENHIGGAGCIGRLNDAMRKHKWQDGLAWKDVMNDITVEECWKLYEGDWEAMNKRHKEEQE